MRVDVVIIGGGFAGTSAAITLARANRSIVLVDSHQPRNRFSGHSHGVLGFDSASPIQMLESGRHEFQSFGGEIISETATSLTPSEKHSCKWKTELESGEVVYSRHVIVATGITDKLPDIPGLEKLWGNRVFHCPYCHGYEVKNKNLVVIGGKNPSFTFRIAKLLTKWTDRVTFYPHGLELSQEENRLMESLGITIEPYLVQGVTASERSDGGVVLDVGQEKIKYEACFTGPEFVPNDSILKQAGCAVEHGWVKAESGMTSLEGIWAAGNVISSPDQVPQALGAGAAVAVKVDQKMFDEDISC
ncbi:FAD-dependent oxidoreductase [Corynebacterium macginleyi]|uniref:NAD(P)/FAD-dependent oxidoreductase n=1 Tax=Corynebacterium macginleyi TaxID=38290 RepID=UPI00190DF782|nr:NAD(P)/FAD-dependent oxidoreductase [Corynebacterium macginleyi]MBK4174201.1 FAD-dependent oxidoreductase [Corynebacterium macginleyi]